MQQRRVVVAERESRQIALEPGGVLIAYCHAGAAHIACGGETYTVVAGEALEESAESAIIVSIDPAVDAKVFAAIFVRG